MLSSSIDHVWKIGVLVYTLHRSITYIDHVCFSLIACRTRTRTRLRSWLHNIANANSLRVLYVDKNLPRILRETAAGRLRFWQLRIFATWFQIKCVLGLAIHPTERTLRSHGAPAKDWSRSMTIQYCNCTDSLSLILARTPYLGFKPLRSTS
jgi:hypothetical protein